MVGLFDCVMLGFNFVHDGNSVGSNFGQNEGKMVGCSDSDSTIVDVADGTICARKQHKEPKK